MRSYKKFFESKKVNEAFSDEVQEVIDEISDLLPEMKEYKPIGSFLEEVIYYDSKLTYAKAVEVLKSLGMEVHGDWNDCDCMWNYESSGDDPYVEASWLEEKLYDVQNLDNEFQEFIKNKDVIQFMQLFSEHTGANFSAVNSFEEFENEVLDNARTSDDPYDEGYFVHGDEGGNLRLWFKYKGIDYLRIDFYSNKMFFNDGDISGKITKLNLFFDDALNFIDPDLITKDLSADGLKQILVTVKRIIDEHF